MASAADRINDGMRLLLTVGPILGVLAAYWNNRKSANSKIVPALIGLLVFAGVVIAFYAIPSWLGLRP